LGNGSTASAVTGSYLPLTGGSLSGALNEAKGTDIASGTTTDIGAATGNYVEITGTNTIASFGTIQAGTIRYIRFMGALTITYNATSMILPGARDIKTTAGDRAIFVSLGSGNWVCISFLKVSGLVLGDTVILTFSGDTGLTSDQVRGQSIYVTGNKKMTLPTGQIGMNTCVFSVDATVKYVDVTGSDFFFINGAALAAGHQLNSVGVIGDTLCVEFGATNTWFVLPGSNVNWVDGG
jgi:hypothetical protein